MENSETISASNQSYQEHLQFLRSDLESLRSHLLSLHAESEQSIALALHEYSLHHSFIAVTFDIAVYTALATIPCFLLMTFCWRRRAVRRMSNLTWLCYVLLVVLFGGVTYIQS